MLHLISRCFVVIFMFTCGKRLRVRGYTGVGLGIRRKGQGWRLGQWSWGGPGVRLRVNSLFKGSAYGIYVYHRCVLSPEHRGPLFWSHSFLQLSDPWYNSVVSLEGLGPRVYAIIWLCIWCLRFRSWSFLPSALGSMSG